MSKMNAEKRKRLITKEQEDIKMMRVGLGAAQHVGSDRYPYYVAEMKILKDHYIIGLYRPNSHFWSSWTEGSEIVDEFDPSRKPEFWLRMYCHRWTKCDSEGNILAPRCRMSLMFGAAVAFSDPSF